MPVPGQPGADQPAKAEPGAGVAVRVTTAPLLNSALQAPGQAIPAGSLLTEPCPAPEVVSLSVWPGPAGPKA